MNKFEFLGATRFWALVILASIIYLQSKGYIGKEEALLLETIAGGFIGVRTVDRFSERIM